MHDNSNTVWKNRLDKYIRKDAFPSLCAVGGIHVGFKLKQMRSASRPTQFSFELRSF